MYSIGLSLPDPYVVKVKPLGIVIKINEFWNESAKTTEYFQLWVLVIPYARDIGHVFQYIGPHVVLFMVWLTY